MAYADPAVRRARDRERVALRTAARIEAGLCVKCGRTEPLPERRLCAPCNEKRNAASRARDARLRAANKLRRDPAREREYERERSRRQHAERRARGRCVECNAPSPGVARCEPCSRRHRESSGAFRGIPIWDPTWTVIEIATGRELGTFDSEAEIALCLAFEKLSRDEVEVISDISQMATLTAPSWW